jgi:hypothetical protein
MSGFSAFDRASRASRAERAGRRLWRLGLSRGLLALALILPGAAYPLSLSQLLSLPFEELLRLQISAHQPARKLPVGSTSRLPTPAARGTS